MADDNKGSRRWIRRLGPLWVGVAAAAGTFAAVAAGWAAVGQAGRAQLGFAVVASLTAGLLAHLQVRKELTGRQPTIGDHGIAGTVRVLAHDRAVREIAGDGADLFQLPPGLVDFTGREEQSAQVRDLLESGVEERVTAVVVSAIAGKGGVGKTTLAIHVAHQVRAWFPDGQLYVNLRGAEAQSLDPADVLAEFLRNLGVAPTAVPDGLAVRARLYRARLSGRRVLVVLDNAADEAQVRPLLPGDPGCAVLVTSRSRLAGLEGAITVDLDVLEPGEAVELLGKVAGPERVAGEPEATAELARVCGYLPLAVRIVGARLAAKPHWRLAAYAGRRRDERKRLGELRVGDLEVRASFALSYQALRQDERQAFRLLGSLDAPDFQAWVAAALVDCAVEAAENLVERLVDAQLLEIGGRISPGVSGIAFTICCACSPASAYANKTRWRSDKRHWNGCSALILDWRKWGEPT